MGKYDKLIAKLKLARLGEPPEYQEKINLIKNALREEFGAQLQASTLIPMYVGVRDEKDALNEQLKEVQMRLTALEQLVDERYEAEDITNLKMADGTAVNIQREPYSVVLDRDEVRLWAMRSGLERSLALPWQTLNSHVKELLTQGESLPPGIKLWSRATVKLTRGHGGDT